MISKVKKGVKIVLDSTDIDDKIIASSKKITEKTLEQAKKFKQEIKKNIITAVTAAFGFMIALTWRDAIQEALNKFLAKFEMLGNAYLYKFIVAFIITIICVIGIIVISRFSSKEEKSN